MKRFLGYLTLTLILHGTAFSQNLEEAYKGGIKSFSKLLQKEIRYPAYERRGGIEGTVIIKFNTSNGETLDNVAVVSPVSPGLDSDALRVFKLSSGQWRLKPNEFYLVPISFKLAGSKVNVEQLKNERDRWLEKGNLNGMLYAAEEIRRRKPFDFDNLEIMKKGYRELSQNNKSDEIDSIIDGLKSGEQLKFN